MSDESLPTEKTPEQLAAEARLAVVGSEKLIPDALKTNPEVKGKVEIFARQKPDKSVDGHSSVRFVIADEKLEPFSELISHVGEGHWDYLDGEDIDAFPELTVGDKERRILVFGTFSEINPNMLFTGMLEINPAFRGKGIGQAFQANLAKIARNLGYKFICGYQNNADIAFFFLENGRYLLEEVKDELQEEFRGLVEQDQDDDVFRTIKILNPEDVEKYIRPTRIGKSTIEKIDFKSKHIEFDKIAIRLTRKIEEAKRGKSKLGDPATVTEIIQDLNETLGEQKADFSNLSGGDKDFPEKAQSALDFLIAKRSTFLQGVKLATLVDYKETLDS